MNKDEKINEMCDICMIFQTLIYHQIIKKHTKDRDIRSNRFEFVYGKWNLVTKVIRFDMLCNSGGKEKLFIQNFQNYVKIRYYSKTSQIADFGTNQNTTIYKIHHL